MIYHVDYSAIIKEITMKDKITKAVPHFATFVGLSVIIGAGSQIAGLDKAYVFPLFYLAGAFHHKLSALIGSKMK